MSMTPMCTYLVQTAALTARLTLGYLTGTLKLNIPKLSSDIPPQICLSTVVSILLYGNSIFPVTKTKTGYY